jgi:hypothetical protein
MVEIVFICHWEERARDGNKVVGQVVFTETPRTTFSGGANGPERTLAERMQVDKEHMTCGERRQEAGWSGTSASAKARAIASRHDFVAS